MSTAVVVGSGPNGLAAAIVLAQAGVDVTVLEAHDSIGGGTRTEELTLPGVLHDVCSAAHPTGLASPFFRALPLAEHGLEWLWPEIDAVHPLDDGRGAALYRDLDRTVEGLGVDGDRWRRVFGPLVEHKEALVDELFGPIVHVPAHPLVMARFGVNALLPSTVFARRFEDPQTRALFAGMSDHAVQPPTRPTTAALGLMFGTFSHGWGWPVAKGGSISITRAMASLLEKLGGRIETGHRVTELPQADLVMLDTSPDQALRLAGDRAPWHVRRSLRTWRYGPGTFKVDFAVAEGVPWTNEKAHHAGTVHLGGEIEEVNAAEQAIAKGRMPERPFVIVCQQHLADPSRSNGDVHPIWAYAHVPHGYEGDATEAVIAQIERFAPGFRERILAQAVRGPQAWHDYNANYVGGDIAGGANDPWQVVMRPRMSPDPYRVADGVYLCSASTPPGGGVHGMSGFQAAVRAVRSL